ncbi:MAG: Rnf-Nqr domain containing protein, partial [Kiritimatiellae bacterium]|nr:Rnf-Nqr domain containing protein [Kiritimatiellia bacterium]
TWTLQRFVLRPLGLEYLQTIAFILVIAAFVQLVEIILKRFAAALHAALGIYLPLITTNCAVLGVAVMNVKERHNFGQSVVFATAAAVGFSFALVIFTGLREKIDRADPPRAFRGVAIALVTAGLLSLAFMGFNGLVK